MSTLEQKKGKRILEEPTPFSNSPNCSIYSTHNDGGPLLRKSSKLSRMSNSIFPKHHSSNFSSTSGQVSSNTFILPKTTLASLDETFYFDCGDCNQVCQHCDARFWFAEKISHSTTPKYNQCCKGGSVKVQLSKEPPTIVKHLFERKDFLESIRAYNSMFSMTSFGANIDDTINNGSSPYVFKIEGQVCHWIGSLCPPPNESPRFLQMYIYDTENEISNRLRFFNGSTHSQLQNDIVQTLITILENSNEVVKLFRSARDLLIQNNVPNFKIHLYSSHNQRTYDMPTPGSIGAILYENESSSNDFDIVIHLKDGHPQRISKLNPLYMSLQYPLLFLYGERGWSPDLKQFLNGNPTNKNLTMNMFYSYQLHDRDNSYAILLRSGRLFQQYLVDAYVCIEQNRLDYIKSHQNIFRSEYLKGIHDALEKGDTEGHTIGKRTFLPSSFTGGPRYMYKHYQDALAICRVHGNPQYFITFTCNVKWPEIERYLSDFPSLTAQDRPDIIARVFQIKVDALIQFLKSESPLGQVIADLYTIEFQKRGLPHCHMLLWVTQTHKIQQAEEVDNFVSAEIPDPTKEPQLYKIITNLMMHGPCGIVKPNAPCMAKGSCSKHFPKEYVTTTTFDKNGYVHYKRRQNGNTFVKKGMTLDNGYVVPYNKTLCLRFHAHINVEYCGWNMMIKYLFKYISKGCDRIRFTITKRPTASTNPTSQAIPQVDEIKNYQDGRFICPHEASWRIFNFPIHYRNPPVQVLSVHLENMQNIRFKDTQRLRTLVNNPLLKKTTLTEWLLKNKSDETGRHLRYIDYLSEYRWELSSKSWIRRTTYKTPAIGRLIYVHPTCGETFYLRMLLCYQKGCQSFIDIRTIMGEIFPTYRSACERLGLLGDNKEWVHSLDEAAAWATPAELRSLFTHMLLFCDISNPLELWNKQWRMMADDLILRLTIPKSSTNTHINEDELKQYVLYEIELLLNTCGSSSTLLAYGLPMPRADLIASLQNRLLLEEKNYDREKLALDLESYQKCLHPHQRRIYDLVNKSLEEKRQILLFVYGHGGTGKTFLWTTILASLRSQGKIVLAVAASGIASLLLPSGRTAHSRFKIPLNLTNESICHIKKNTHLEKLLLETNLIIWDEAPMNDRKCFESLDKSLRDLLNNPNELFGGKSILLGGDFRQTLPVIPKASKAEIIASTLPHSYLWKHFKIYKLTENMRLQRNNLTPNKRIETTTFSSWLLDVGDGKLGTPDADDPINTKKIEIPSKFLIPYNDLALDELIHFIYDHETINNPSSTNLSKKAIVCPKNETCEHINNIVLNLAVGNKVTYFSTDSIIPHANNIGDLDILYPPEYLNLLDFNGLPPHKLELKVNAPIMLLRNINQTAGLCNGTRLIVTQLLPRVVEAKVITGTASGYRVYIPRIILTYTNKDLPFTFKRKQFPLKLCYAMTINKSQGQSLNKIGVYLPQPIFGHGQLYVAFSRATSPNALRVLIVPQEQDPPNITKNIVYSQFLNQIHDITESLDEDDRNTQH